MRKMIVLAGALAMTGAAHAGTCRGKLLIQSVLGTGRTGRTWQYFVEVQNLTTKPLHWELKFQNMPAGVNLTRNSFVAGAPLGGGATRANVGSGKFDSFNTMTFGYDSGSQQILAVNCQ